MGNRVELYLLELQAQDYTVEICDQLQQQLPVTSKVHLKPFTNTHSRLQTLAGETLARFALQQFSGLNTKFEFSTLEKGKPVIKNYADLHFNISHSGNYVVCAVANTVVGIDIERERKPNLRIAERYFSPAELADLMQFSETERQKYFITLWTIKESYLKAIGSGLTQRLNSFTVAQTATGFMFTDNEEAENFGVEILQLPDNYKVSVCSKKPFFITKANRIELKKII